MKNSLVQTSVIAVMVAIGSFMGGVGYQKSKDSLVGVSAQNLTAKLQSLGFNRGNGAGGAGFAGRGGVRRAGAVAGQVLSKDAQSVTVKLTDGSTKIVYISGATVITNSVPAALSDISIGKQIVANGNPNSDGSVATTTIQIHPN